MDRDYDVITFISKYLYFKEAWSNHHIYENDL